MTTPDRPLKPYAPFKHSAGKVEGNRAARLGLAREAALERRRRKLAAGGLQESYPKRIVATFSGIKLSEIRDQLRDIQKAHPEVKSKEQLLVLVDDTNREQYRRALDVMSHLLSKKRKIKELKEAIVWEKTLPDGTTREMQPECKYFNPEIPAK